MTSAYTTTEFTIEVISNREGIRDIDHARQKPEGLFRIIILGDSYVEGVGAAYEDAWFKVLEKRLCEQGYPIEVLSGGNAGSDIFYTYQMLKHKLLHYNPDLVIVSVNNSDIDDILYRGGMERFHEDGTTHFRKGPWFEKLYAISHLARYIIEKPLGYDPRLIKRSKKKQVNRDSQRAIASCMSRFQQLGRENEFKLMAILHPVPDELR